MSNNHFLEQFTNFSENARKSLVQASEIATDLGANYIRTKHLLLGILAQRSSTGARLLKQFGVTYDRVNLSLAKDSSQSRGNSPKTQVQRFSEQAELAIKTSQNHARTYNHDICGTEHLVLSIACQSQADATEILTNMNVSPKKLQEKIKSFLGQQVSGSVLEIFQAPSSDSSYQEFAREIYNKVRRISQQTERPGRSKTSVLDHFGSNLTNQAEQGLLDPVVGRQPQISRAITILNRRQKNNPVLIGEPGVGKTAIVEGLAQKIVSEDVPETLLDRRIITLDLASMIAGTKYRGEFEERFRRIIAELDHHKKTIVFIDEIHLLVGAGAAEGAIDASNMLKPVLARGNLQIIGATTTNEYSKHIEKDAALERRLQPIMVPATNREETLAILRGLVKRYEKHHQVSISEEVLVKAVDLADRYLTDRFMPDKAIDLIDEAAAHLRVERSKINPAERDVCRQIRLVNHELEQLVENEDYDQAAANKKEIEELEKKLSQIRGQKQPASWPRLSQEQLAAVVATWTGVPANQVLRSEAKALLNLEKRLGKKIIGQTEAVKVVAEAIRRSRSGVSSPSRPIGSFLLLGPTGVGKTELARTLAKDFYGREEALIKIDMSEFAERHTVARLIGAPAGYVGFDQPGQLTEKVRRQPYSLVLFDEIEKAHPDIFNLLLQILEDGQLSDAKGRSVNFANTIVILTSNLGAIDLQKEFAFGFDQSKNSESDQEKQNERHETAVKQALKEFMRPELINRLDKTIIFKSLSQKDVQKIVLLQLEELSQRLLKQGLALVISPAVKKYLAQEGYDKTNGVRPLRRLIQDKIETNISNCLLARPASDGEDRVLKVDINRDKEIIVDLASENLTS